MTIGVAPLVGARIEMSKNIDCKYNRTPSLPLWERGLKYNSVNGDRLYNVAPLVGARIEIAPLFHFLKSI